ncbi:MAG: DUF6249 domain-containing protein [Planctomycetota bacterium]|jgi:hypothetical protein
MVAALQVFLILIGCSAPIIIVGVVYYLKKRLEHTQIMAAIEKGTPLSEIMPPKPKPSGPPWIRYLSIGIALLIIGFGFIVGPTIGRGFEAVIAFVLLGVGIAWIIRSLLHRRYYMKNQNSLENNTTEKKNPAKS